MKTNFYITTTLPYVNAEPHVGFALEIVQADAVARARRLLGDEVFFNTGTDEHGLKIHRKAEEQGIPTQEYVDLYAAKFDHLRDLLNLSYTHFIRTTDPHHKKAAQEFWKRCAVNGDIYKAKYTVKYCVGCELEKTESELVDGKCPLHPNLELELIDEENYFFRFSKYQKPLLELYKAHPEFVKPAHRLEEIRNFVQEGLTDFSISRLASKMPWGVPVPGDEEHVMYVWFDALVNYISTTGWPENPASFEQWWPGTQVAGKDNLRQQSAMWQAMLLSAQLPPSKQIIVHGFITSEGKKMSKSVGNVVSPAEIVERFGTEATRYYLLHEIPALDDGDFSYQRMQEIYNSDLANELGNLVMRLTTLGAKDELSVDQANPPDTAEDVFAKTSSFQFNEALELIWKEIKKLNKEIDGFEPWKKQPAERGAFLISGLQKIYQIAYLLQPFMPGTAAIIMEVTSGTISKCPPLFPKKQ
jgi:methionyl-tRNA synthetase